MPMQPEPLRARSSDDVFRILALCSDSARRAGQVEQLLRTRLPQALPTRHPGTFQFVSADTSDAIDSPSSEPIALVAQADLVITLSSDDRRMVHDAVPMARDRTFTLNELMGSLESIADGRPPQFVRPLGGEGVASFLDQVTTAAETSRARASESEGRDIDLLASGDFSEGCAEVPTESLEDEVDRLVGALRRIAIGGWPMASRRASSTPASA